MSQDFKKLETIAAMVFDAELSKLNALSKKMASGNAELKALATARATRSAALLAGRAGEDLAFLRGQDALWSAWSVRKGAQVSRDVAELGREREEQRVRAKTAFGKRDALRQMQARAEAQIRQKKSRQHEF